MEIKTPDGKTIAKVTAADPNVAGCDEGAWVELVTDDGTKPVLCLVKDKPDGPHKGALYLGVYRDTRNSKACDLAVLFDKENGPILQITKGTEVKQVNLFDLK